MRALEFRTCVNPDYALTVPPRVASQVLPEQPIRVILLVRELPDDQGWARLTNDQFLSGYAESDAIYDRLPTG